MLRLNGEYFDPDKDLSDAYYGVILYGWSFVREIKDSDAKLLLEIGIANMI